MLDAENTESVTAEAAAAAGPDIPETPAAPAKKAAAKKAPAKKAPAKKTAAKRTTKKAAAAEADTPVESPSAEPAASVDAAEAPAETPAAPAKKAAAKKTAAKKTTTAKKTAAKRTTKKVAAADEGTSEPSAAEVAAEEPTVGQAVGTEAELTEEELAEAAAAEAAAEAAPAAAKKAPAATALLFQAPDATAAPTRRKRAASKKAAQPAAEAAEAPESAAVTETPAEAEAAEEAPKKRPARKRAQAKPAREEAAEEAAELAAETEPTAEQAEAEEAAEGAEGETEQGGARRRRRRGGRRRRRGNGGEESESAEAEGAEAEAEEAAEQPEAEGEETAGAGTRRRRRRRRAGEEGAAGGDEPPNTVTRVRRARTAEDEITSVSGSTRLEAKKQRRREGREAGRRRAPIVSEAEFLARREAVDRVMVIRQHEDLTQIAVLEDKVLVEHYVARESQTSLIGNVYLGRVQNVLPSMEAAFIDIGKGRNAVLYAGEVNWDALGAKDGGQRKIEQVLKSGQSVLVQVTKDPIGHKGARLTSQISLPGRFLVYVPDGTTSGISRKLPDTERSRLKTLLKEIVPDSAGVIVRTAAEGASEDELTRDVERLTARWEDIQSRVQGGNAPQLLYGEPDLTLKVVRDLFTEDFGRLVVSGDDAWDMVDGYVQHVAPDLADRLERYDGGQDVFAAYRIDEQIAKGLDRKVWLPSGGSLIIDRTEAMTVIDVNTGKFTGSGGNLEETVTKNNLEAAEEIVRQLRLRDIGGIIVVDFIDMVLESNRDLVLRRMVECLGRDRTRHQVAEVTSLGLVQMTRKRIGTGLLEAFSENCEHCQGRGLIVHHEPIEPKKKAEEEPRRSRRGGRNRGKGEDEGREAHAPSPKDVAAMAKPEPEKPEPEKPEPVKAEPVKAESAESVDAGKPEAAEQRRPEAAPTEPEAAEQRRPEAEAAEPEATEAAAVEQPAAPKVVTVTTTRRRGARRPAGRPDVSTASETAPTHPQPVAAEPSAPAEAAVTAPAAEAEQAVTVAETAQPPAEPAAAPKVVTSVRRRGAARRAAGPPPAVAQADGAAADAAADGAVHPDGDADVELPVDEHGAAVHVPVKKKGSRKR